MVESVSDAMSLISLGCIPIIMLTMVLLSIRSKHKKKVIANREQYFREW